MCVCVCVRACVCQGAVSALGGHLLWRSSGQTDQLPSEAQTSVILVHRHTNAEHTHVQTFKYYMQSVSIFK